MVFILTFVYIAYGLAESCEETGGSTESILLILKSVLLTMLSFQEIGGTIFGALVTSGMAVMAYKFWICKEKKTDLFEIIFLCAEAVIHSDKKREQCGRFPGWLSWLSGNRWLPGLQ